MGFVRRLPLATIMKRTIKILSILLVAILLFWFGWFMNDMSKFAEGVIEDTKMHNYTELNDTIITIEISNQDSLFTQNEIQVDSLLQVIIISQFDDLRKKIENREINKIAKHINFPLGPRSGYAFGYEAENDTVFLTQEKFIRGFDSFFRKPFVDSLSLDNQTLEIYKKRTEIRWLIHINTWDPANESREWGLECSHSIWGYATDSMLIIDGFDLLCGGVM